jgi:hypothetical protein
MRSGAAVPAIDVYASVWPEAGRQGLTQGAPESFAAPAIAGVPSSGICRVAGRRTTCGFRALRKPRHVCIAERIQSKPGQRKPS